MKKQLFLMSALALTALTSCGGQGGGIKVGLICLHDKNSTYDANFIEAFESACEDAKKAGRIGEYSYVTDVSESSDCFDAAERFVTQGYSIIFSDSYGHDEWMRKAAQTFPNVFFCSATGDKANIEDELPNYHNAFASIYEGRYLAGVAAGEYLLENDFKGKDTAGTKVQLGYVGAFPYAEVVSGYTSWYLGVKSMFKQADVKMMVTFTSSWYDYTAEATAAKTLIDKGCVLISQHADSMGAPNTCKENNIPNVSYNINTSEMDPTCKGTYVAHSRINWKPYYETVLKTAVGSVIPGEKGHDWTGTLSGGSVEYNVSDLVKNKQPVIDAADALKKGTLHVFDTSKFTYSGATDEHIAVDQTTKHLTKYEVDINGNNPKTEEKHIPVWKSILATDAQGVSFIRESEERSAPSFALDIDGIEKL